jgi:hypothetical protein
VTTPRYPSLYQINTRVWLTELSGTLGKRATLDDIPDVELDRLAQMGFDWIWFLSAWQTGPAAHKISRANPEWRKDFTATLPDLREDLAPWCYHVFRLQRLLIPSVEVTSCLRSAKIS